MAMAIDGATIMMQEIQRRQAEQARNSQTQMEVANQVREIQGQIRRDRLTTDMREWEADRRVVCASPEFHLRGISDPKARAVAAAQIESYYSCSTLAPGDTVSVTPRAQGVIANQQLGGFWGAR